MAKFRSIINGIAGFIYDFTRFYRHTSSIDITTSAQRSYRVAKVYHSLEKSLSFRDRSPQSGWTAARQLVELLSSRPKGACIDFHERVAMKVLNDFLAASGSRSEDVATTHALIKELGPIDPITPGGILFRDLDQLSSGTLDDPEKFFLTRRSVRDFSERAVAEETIERAILLATSSPSVCNRQAWHVYVSDKRNIIDRALTFQNGNTGFGHQVRTLLVVCADLAAFHDGMERYQHWIDGGMFAMSIVLALHSLGVASCCLNWSRGPRQDVAFRKAFNVVSSHSVVMMIAVGYPNDVVKVCASPRRPLGDILSTLEPTENA